MAIPSPANKHSTVTNICWWEVERKCFCAATCRKLERDFSLGHLFLTSTHATCRSVPTSLNVNVSKTVFMQFWEQTSLWPRQSKDFRTLRQKRVCLCRFGQISNQKLSKEESFYWKETLTCNKEISRSVKADCWQLCILSTLERKLVNTCFPQNVIWEYMFSTKCYPTKIMI